MSLASSLLSGLVSTHSRPKAAGRINQCQQRTKLCFNTQPPEGGWAQVKDGILSGHKFQHTAARRRLAQT